MKKFLDILKAELLEYYREEGLNPQTAELYAIKHISAKYLVKTVNLYNEQVLHGVLGTLSDLTDRVSEAGDDSGDKCYVNEYDVRESILNLKEQLL